MTALVSAETILVVLLLVLVAGLLRSHAEILRRLGPADGSGEDPDARRVAALERAAPPRNGDAPAPALTGTTPAGDAIRLDFAGAHGAPTLLAFLSTGCTSCAGFWETLAQPRLPDDVETVIVTRGAERERLRRVRELAPEGVPVVMSSPAWEDYRVPGSPYFVLVEGAIRGEGVATSWQALSSLVADAIEDDRVARGSDRSGPGRARDVDAALTAGGIGPGHPSLYPAGRSAGATTATGPRRT
jgi:hypothetical protein